MIICLSEQFTNTFVCIGEADYEACNLLIHLGVVIKAM